VAHERHAGELVNSSITYFAYGSNMSSRRLKGRNRAPSAQAKGRARLRDWALVFNKRGSDGSAKANIQPERGKVVWGVLFDLPCSELKNLDRVEGLGKGYEHRWVEVERDGSEPVTALTYVGTDLADGLRPCDWYKDYVVEGAQEHGLPPYYICALKQVPTWPGGRCSAFKKE